jgi:hypothetical protein
VNSGRSCEGGVGYKLCSTVSLESSKCARLLGRDDLPRKASSVIIDGVNFSGGNKAAGVSIGEAVRTDHVIALTSAEAEGPGGAGGAVGGN